MKRSIVLLCVLPLALAACGVVATSDEELVSLPAVWTAAVTAVEEPLLVLELTAGPDADPLVVNTIDVEILRRDGWQRLETFPSSCWDPDPESELEEQHIRCWVSPEDSWGQGTYRLRVWVRPAGGSVESAILTDPFDYPS